MAGIDLDFFTMSFQNLHCSSLNVDHLFLWGQMSYKSHEIFMRYRVSKNEIYSSWVWHYNELDQYYSNSFAHVYFESKRMRSRGEASCRITIRVTRKWTRKMSCVILSFDCCCCNSKVISNECLHPLLISSQLIVAISAKLAPLGSSCCANWVARCCLNGIRIGNVSCRSDAAATWTWKSHAATSLKSCPKHNLWLVPATSLRMHFLLTCLADQELPENRFIFISQE